MTSGRSGPTGPAPRAPRCGWTPVGLELAWAVLLSGCAGLPATEPSSLEEQQGPPPESAAEDRPLLSRSGPERVGEEGLADSNPGSGAAPAAAPPATSTEESGAAGSEERGWWRGRVSARYRGRWRGGERDHDLTTTLSLDGGDPLKDAWTTSLLASLFVDLDGLSDPDESLFGLNDTWDHSVLGRVYHAFVDRHGSGELRRVRLGRQLDWETPEQAWFDGASFLFGELAPGQPEFGLYGGVPVHAYESSQQGDLLAGAWAELMPWKAARARLDWMHLEDDYLARDHEQDLAGLALWQRLGQRVRVEAGYTNLDGDSRDVRAAASWVSEDGELALRARYDRLLETQRSQAIETDPFFNSLQELFPYEQARLTLSKQWDERFRLEGGVDFRQVDDENDEGQFNRDFDRTFVNASALDWLPLELEATLTYDVYDSGDIETRVLGGDLSRDFGRSTRASLGTYYGLYKYDLLSNSEREDVRTWYLRVRRRLDERTRIDLGYEYEDDDLDEYHTLRVGTTWSF